MRSALAGVHIGDVSRGRVVGAGPFVRESRVAGRLVKTQELLSLPKEVIPLAVVALGYPAEKPGPVDRFDASRIHKNRW